MNQNENVNFNTKLSSILSKHKPLNTAYLISNNYWTVPDNKPLSIDWKRFGPFSNYIFKGQYDPLTGLPCGIIKLIDDYFGCYYEGQWEGRSRNGFNIFYRDTTNIQVGWYKDNRCHGNCVYLNNWQPVFEGWYENDRQVGPRKEDLDYKNFEL